METHIFENQLQSNKIDDIGTSLDDFEILEMLGKERNVSVIKVKSKKDKKIYAMKKIDLTKANNEQINLFKNEIEIIQNLNSPHILKYHSHFKEGNKIYLIMEYSNNRNIKEYIKALDTVTMNKAIEEKELLKLLYQCISGINYLHQNQIIHRDIKPENIFLTDDKIIKIGNFAYSVKRKNVDENYKPEKETFFEIEESDYMSPEIIQHQPYESKVDIYSLGCIFHELCFFTPPRELIRNENKEIIDLIDIPPKYNIGKYSKELLDVIEKMIEKDQDKRSSSSNIFQEIKKIYNLIKIHSTSIYCTYRALLSQEIVPVKIKKHAPKEREKIEKMPITHSLDLAMENILIPSNTGYPIILQIRDILTSHNSKFTDPGEIDCLDLIDYIIQNLLLENNHNSNNRSAHIFTLENDANSINRTDMLNQYFFKFSNSFKSFVSNNFFGTFEFNRICTQCCQRRTFFENFFYLTLNYDNALKYSSYANGQNIINYYLQNCSEIIVNKFCPHCNNITKQREIKEIFIKPNNIIIYIKREVPNNFSNINYPFIMQFPSVQYSQLGNIISNITNYSLKAVIQQYTENEDKLYGCIFHLNQMWCFCNGYNIMKYGNSPYNFNFGNVVMLFYSCEN